MSQVILQNKIQKDDTSLGALVGKTITSASIPNGTTKIGKYSFAYCSALTNVTIPDSVTTIEESAFYYCTHLLSLSIPDSVSILGTAICYYCNRLANVTLSNNITEIGDMAFYRCDVLPSIIIPSSITSIGEQAFRNCYLLDNVTVNALTPPTLGYNPFGGTSENLVIYVPAESVDTYKEASGWSSYASKIQAIPTWSLAI